MLGGMGTVDVRGGFGTYTLYTDRPVEKDDPKGDIELVRVHDLDLDGRPETARGILRGPPDQFHLEPGQVPSKSDYLTAGCDDLPGADQRDAAVVEIGGQRALLRRGRVVGLDGGRLRRPAHGSLAGQRASCASTPRSSRPASRSTPRRSTSRPPAPAMPLTSPDDFVEELFESLGFFYTQGMPEETDALKDGVFDDDDYLKQVALVQEDNWRMVELALDRFEPGDITFVVPLGHRSAVPHAVAARRSQVRRAPRSPGLRPRRSRPGTPTTSSASTATWTGPSARSAKQAAARFTLLVVMSDHGFQPYTREAPPERVAARRGLPALMDGKTHRPHRGWRRRLVEDAGLRPRLQRSLPEPRRPGGAGHRRPRTPNALIDEISRKLESLRDPENGKRVVLRVDRSERRSTARNARAEGPDLVVGYDGIRLLRRIDPRRDHRGGHGRQRPRAGRATT